MRSELRQRLVRLGPFLGLLLVVAFFALASGAPERYLSANNLRVVLAQTVIVAIGAIGMTLVIVGGGIDLAVGSTIALTGVLCALALRDGWAPLPRGPGRRSSPAALVGLVNGLAITRLRVVPVHRHPRHARRRARARPSGWPARRPSTRPPTWVNELAVTFPPAPVDGLRARRLDRARPRAPHGLRPAPDRVRPPRVRPRLERGGGARLRHRDRPPQARDLRGRRPASSASPA